MKAHSLRCTTREGSKPIVRKLEAAVGVEGSDLVVRFTVQCLFNRVNPRLPIGESAWELWNWDVVEVFVRPVGRQAYYEFQISPLGQHFELEVIEPRKNVNKDYRSDGAFKADGSSPNWTAEFRIPLAALGARPGAALEGGLFGIFGPEGAREYWSAFLPEQAAADFHKPDHFQALS